MATVVLRQDLSRPLTALEADANIKNINDALVALTSVVAGKADAGHSHPALSGSAIVSLIDTALGSSVWQGGGSGGTNATNLSATANPTTIVVASDTGTDATISLADGTNAGLMSPAQFTKLGNVEAGATADMTGAEIVAAITANLGSTVWQSGAGGSATNLSMTASPMGIALNSDTGTDVTLPLSDGTNAGLLSPAQHSKLAGVEANATADLTGAEIVALINTNLGSSVWQGGGGGGATNLTTTADTVSVTVSSDTGTDAILAAASGSAAGVMTAAQFTKLGGIATGATANAADATLQDRANHTGTQIALTISDFTEAAQDVIGAMVTAAGGSYNDATNTITLPASGSSAVVPEDVAGTTYTVLVGDLGKVKRFTNAAGCSVSVPASLGTGFNCSLLKGASAGDVTVSGVGATVSSSSGGLVLTETLSMASLIAQAANDYLLVGQIGNWVEETQDVIGALVVAAGGSYDDTAGTVVFPSGGGSTITVQEEGVPLATVATVLNIVGAGATATGTGGTKTLTIPGFTAEEAQDAVATVMVLPSGAYNDAGNSIRLPIVFPVAASDEGTALTPGTSKIVFHMPVAMTLTAVMAGLTVAQASGAVLTVDINEGLGLGTSVLSTKITFNNAQETSLTATTQPVISDTAIAKGARMSIDIDQVGDGTAKGLKVYLVGFITGF